MSRLLMPEARNGMFKILAEYVEVKEYIYKIDDQFSTFVKYFKHFAFVATINDRTINVTQNITF